MYGIYFSYLKRNIKKLIFFYVYSIIPMFILERFGDVYPERLFLFGVWSVIMTSSTLLVAEIIDMEKKDMIYKRILVNRDVHYLLHRKAYFVSMVDTGYLVSFCLMIFFFGRQFGLEGLCLKSDFELVGVLILLLIAMTLVVRYLIYISFLLKNKTVRNMMRLTVSMLLLAAVFQNSILFYVIFIFIGICVNYFLSRIIDRYTVETILNKHLTI